MMSEAVEGMWIHMGSYGWFRGKWVDLRLVKSVVYNLKFFLLAYQKHFFNTLLHLVTR